MNVWEWLREQVRPRRRQREFEGTGAVQLDWARVAPGWDHAVLAGRALRSRRSTEAWVISARAAGHTVIEIGRDEKGAPVSMPWQPAKAYGRSALFEALHEPPRGGGKSSPAQRLWALAYRAAQDDPASTFGRSEFRPV